MISVKHVDKYFNRRKKNEIHVLNDISLDFPSKGLVVLLGASGSGKTTLLNVIGGLDSIQSGKIVIDDQEIEKYDAQKWDEIRNEHIGYIFQNYNLLPELSVFDNIAFVLKMLGIKDKEYIEKRVHYVLRAVNMYPFRKKKALQLSGGQQQRVAIARALVKNPKIIIADEPTGNLDSKNTLEVMNIIKQISSEKLVILVTHEKEIAKFYGNRIIEIKDGQVIQDYFNDEIEDHKMGKDDTIYLKDMQKGVNLSSDHVRLEIFSDEEVLDSPIDIKLVVKNKTLYLDVQSLYNKMKIVDENSGVVIKNEHYVKKTRQELIQTSFDLEEIDHSQIKKDSSSMVSIKQTLRMALEKVLRTGRKGKIMLFSFFIAGMVIAFTIATLASVAIVRPEPYMQISKGYVRTDYKESMPTYNQLMVLGQVDESFYIHPFSQVMMRFLNSDGSEAFVGFNAQIETENHLDMFKLLDGKLPENDREFVITSGIADQLVDTRVGQDFGIWTYSHIYNEHFKFIDSTSQIVGIVESEIPMIFMSEVAATYFTYKDSKQQPYELYDASIILHGQAPQDQEIMISMTDYAFLDPELDVSGTWPKSFPMYNLVVSGIHQLEDSEIKIYTSQTLKEMLIDESKELLIYSNEREELMNALLETYGITSSDVYQDAFETRAQSQRIAFISTLTTSLLLIGFSMVGFYFVIRSSLISRIYEVSVHRALGVKKIDIFRSFVVEIFAISTISTLIGYLLATYTLNQLQDGLLGTLDFFLVTPLTTGLGIVLLYALNLLAGLFPVILLLKKTPAQILSQYDI
ncbi:MAG: ABC transporter ATP-binding protein/permease [Acholeplasmataceae bacterium]|nr:ABC transporter ATP-binding protein/permease [Acholeplasmataceae bacterium]